MQKLKIMSLAFTLLLGINCFSMEDPHSSKQGNLKRKRTDFSSDLSDPRSTAKTRKEEEEEEGSNISSQQFTDAPSKDVSKCWLMIVPEELLKIIVDEVLRNPGSIRNTSNVYKALGDIQEEVRTTFRNLLLVNKHFHNLMSTYPPHLRSLLVKYYRELLRNTFFYYKSEGESQGYYLKSGESFVPEIDPKDHWTDRQSRRIELNEQIPAFIADEKENDDYSVLFGAIRCLGFKIDEWYNLINLLIFFGADTEVVNEDDEHLLAEMFGDPQPDVFDDLLPIFQLLLRKGAKLHNIYTNHHGTGWIPVWHDIASCGVDYLKILLQNKVNVNEIDCRGETMLMNAAPFAHYEAVKLLLKAGAHINLINLKGETALTKTLKEGNLKAALWLIKKGALISTGDVILINKLIIEKSKSKSKKAA